MCSNIMHILELIQRLKSAKKCTLFVINVRFASYPTFVLYLLFNYIVFVAAYSVGSVLILNLHTTFPFLNQNIFFI